jgi:hypothetical protein
MSHKLRVVPCNTALPLQGAKINTNCDHGVASRHFGTINNSLSSAPKQGDFLLQTWPHTDVDIAILYYRSLEDNKDVQRKVKDLSYVRTVRDVILVPISILSVLYVLLMPDYFFLNF